MVRLREANKADIVKRQMLALELRIDGLSYRAIAEKLGVSHETIRQDIEGELKRLADLNLERAAELRQLELVRLDQVIKSLSNWMKAGNVAAASVYIKASERRSKLLGLDAPLKQENNDNLEIIIRREDSNPAYTVPAPGRNIKQPGKVQNRGNRTARGKDDTGETVH